MQIRLKGKNIYANHQNKYDQWRQELSLHNKCTSREKGADPGEEGRGPAPDL